MHPGEKRLKFKIFDSKENINLEMLSRKQKIKISKELLDELKKDKVLFELESKKSASK